MARFVLTGTPGIGTTVGPKDVPDDLRDAYFGVPYGYSLLDPPLLHLTGDWTKKIMTNASAIRCDLDGWAPPGEPGPVGYTRNHGIYLRFNTNVERMVCPPYIPWGEHEMIAAWLRQEAVRRDETGNTSTFSLSDEVLRDLANQAADLLLGDYKRSWQNMVYDIPMLLEGARMVFTTPHPELVEWVNKIPAKAGLIEGVSHRLMDGTTINDKFLMALDLHVPVHDRWEYERYLETFIPAHQPDHPHVLDAKPFRVHIWRLLPLQFKYVCAESPDWWFGEFGS